MKKKIGELIITDKTTQEEERSVIWGTIFKTDDNKLFGGIYLSVSPDMLNVALPMIKHLMVRCKSFRLKYTNEFYGEYFNLGSYGLLSKWNYDFIIGRLAYTESIEEDNYEYEIKMYHDFQYVIDANVVDKI